MACKTGTEDNESIPKPITVETFASNSDTIVLSRACALTA
jgi:hypothetical protein